MPDLFVVWDKKARAMLGHAFPSRSDDEAKRMFLGLVQNKETLVSQYPDDFELWMLGHLGEGRPLPEFAPGAPSTSPEPMRICSAREALENAR